MAFRWRAVDGPLVVLFWILPLIKLKKNVVKVIAEPPLTKHSGSAHAIVVIHSQGLKAIPHISDHSEKTWLNEGADQSAHPASLMRVFVVCSLERIIATLNLAHSKLQASILSLLMSRLVLARFGGKPWRRVFLRRSTYWARSLSLPNCYYSSWSKALSYFMYIIVNILPCTAQCTIAWGRNAKGNSALSCPLYKEAYV